MKVVFSYFLFTAYIKTTWCYKLLKTTPFPSFFEGTYFKELIMNVDDETTFSMIIKP